MGRGVYCRRILRTPAIWTARGEFSDFSVFSLRGKEVLRFRKLMFHRELIARRKLRFRARCLLDEGSRKSLRSQIATSNSLFQSEIIGRRSGEMNGSA